jgi:hypothetical protein
VIVGSCVGMGIVLGLLWVWIAPRPTLVVRDGAAFYESAGKSGISMDMTFGLLGIAAGLVVGIVVAWWSRSGRATVSLGILIAAVGGAAAGSVVAWQLGMTVVGGVDSDGSVLVPELLNGETFVGPLELTALGVLGIWPLTVAVVLAAVLVVRASRTGNQAREAAQAYLDRHQLSAE